MPTAIVTGSGGLVGSEAVRRLAAHGFDVLGIENDMRASFFGESASTSHVTEALVAGEDAFRLLELDIRDAEKVERAFSEAGAGLELVVHTAAQPSHDWAATDPQTDFTVNANGTLNLLEATRRNAPEATFAFISTNKVYGDLPNSLPLVEAETRLELPEDHPYFGGIDATMSIDRSTHSLFGVSKAAADLLVQEYGRYFEMPTVCFRCGCITGPAHAGAMLHGFLAYLAKCTVTGAPYTVFGYGGKQVRDNIHSGDLVEACLAFHAARRPAAVYNMGGGRESNCSMLEAIEACERIAGRELDWELSDEARVGDHRWWISDLGEFRADHPGWKLNYDTERLLREIHDANLERWSSEPG
ncbi:MAG: NAD-dependent epimerase/dehydratase family protein [Solirubrobacterales bacterium]|nr:NAD-dependent epimerase/dehydratase family protein [Solirubrobacterales bacterium]